MRRTIKDGGAKSGMGGKAPDKGHSKPTRSKKEKHTTAQGKRKTNADNKNHRAETKSGSTKGMTKSEIKAGKKTGRL